MHTAEPDFFQNELEEVLRSGLPPHPKATDAPFTFFGEEPKKVSDRLDAIRATGGWWPPA